MVVRKLVFMRQIDWIKKRDKNKFPLTKYMTVEMIVEIPYNSCVKYELDKNNRLVCDRILHTAMAYPGNYGYIPNTLAGDGDPLDVLLICDHPLFPTSRVSIKVIGLLKTEDEKGQDEKLIAVPSTSVDPNYSEINEISDIPKHTLSKIRHFFSHYKDMEEDKWVVVGDFMNRAYAEDLLIKLKT